MGPSSTRISFFTKFNSLRKGTAESNPEKKLFNLEKYKSMNSNKLVISRRHSLVSLKSKAELEKKEKIRKKFVMENPFKETVLESEFIWNRLINDIIEINIFPLVFSAVCSAVSCTPKSPCFFSLFKTKVPSTCFSVHLFPFGKMYAHFSSSSFCSRWLYPSSVWSFGSRFLFLEGCHPNYSIVSPSPSLFLPFSSETKAAPVNLSSFLYSVIPFSSSSHLPHTASPPASCTALRSLSRTLPAFRWRILSISLLFQLSQGCFTHFLFVTVNW